LKKASLHCRNANLLSKDMLPVACFWCLAFRISSSMKHG
jgi:hypothetical protein